MRIVMPVFLLLFVGYVSAHAEIKGQEVEYSANGTTLKGYLAYDDSVKGKRPGVLVVHEWWGLNEYARKRANMLAEMGYTALAVDMYGDGKQAKHPEDAGKFSGELMNNLDVAQKRFEAAIDFLSKQETTDPERIAAIGYCFGGGIVLNMARRGVDIDGVVSYHGMLPTNDPPQPGQVKADVLVFHGGADQFITEEQVNEFKKQMEKANADMTFVVYPGAKHSFTVPEADAYAKEFNIPLGYNAEADQKSWAETQSFLKKTFGEDKGA